MASNSMCFSPFILKQTHIIQFKEENMNKPILIFILTVISFGLCAQSPDWTWVCQAGGSSNETGKAIVSDTEGNCYVAGYFNGSATFGTTTLTSTGGMDIFVAKHDANGIWLWAKRAGGSGTDHGTGIALDAAGNVCVTGYFIGSAAFGATNLNSSGYSDVFVAKLDPSGIWQWAKRAGGTSDDVSYGISADSSGNSYVTGYFYGTAAFGSNSLTSYGSYDSYVAKLDSSGNWLWAKKAGGTGDECSFGIDTDEAGNCFITGYFASSASFGSTTLYSAGGNDDYIAKLDTNGNWLWAKRAGGTSSDYAYAVATDPAGNIFITGYFYTNASFGTSTLSSNGATDVFVAKLDNNGTWLWAKNGGGTGTDYGYGIAADNFGNCLITGYFSDTALFGSTSLSSAGIADIYYAKLDSQGTWITAAKGGGTGNDIGYGVCAYQAGYCHLTGYFNATATFGTLSLVSNGGTDIFVSQGCQPLLAVDFTANVTSGLEPLQVQFTDQSIPGAGTIISRLWDFGNGDTSTLQNPLYTYQQSGVYPVTLTIVNSADSTGSLTKADYITVIPRVPEIEISHSGAIEFGNVYLGASSEQHSLWVRNSGTSILHISELGFYLSSSPFRVVGSPAPAAIAVGDSLAILLAFAPTAVGSFADSLYIHSDAATHPVLAVSLRGTGEYVPPKPPANLTCIPDGNNIVLSWEAVSETIFDIPFTPDYYLVFYNGSNDPAGEFYYHGATPGLSYTHYLVGLHAQHMFYRVIAYKNYARSGSLDPRIHTGIPEAEVWRILSE